MSKESLFKETQVYGWDAEPVDERPSEFTSSGGYSVLTSDYRLDAIHRARRRPGKFGVVGWLVFCVALFVLGGVALVRWLPLLAHR